MGERPFSGETPAGRLTTIEENAPSHGSSQYGHHEHDTSVSGLESGTSSLFPPPSRYLRSSLSSPDLRLNPPLSALPPHSKSPQPSRQAVFSDGAQFGPGKRPWIRRVLKASSCTNCEKFDARDFARVRPARPQTDFFPMASQTAAEMVEDTRAESIKEEQWREGIRQKLYAGANQRSTIIV